MGVAGKQEMAGHAQGHPGKHDRENVPTFPTGCQQEGGGQQFADRQHDQHPKTDLGSLMDQVDRLFFTREQGQRQQRSDDPHAQPADQAAQHEMLIQRLDDLSQPFEGEHKEQASQAANQAEWHSQQKIFQAGGIGGKCI